MQFSSILTPLALVAAISLAPLLPAHAQGRDTAHYDQAITDMAQAYKAHDKKRLSELLPQLRGYVLEPWAAYWDLSSRLDEASSSELQEFFTRFAGSYQEDRLRSEWLLMIGRNRDWAAFNREFPKYRMGDDKSVRCYALLADHLSSGADVNDAVTETWLSLREPDEGCAAAMQQLLDDHSLQSHAVWLRARLGMEYDRLSVAVQALEMLNTSWAHALKAVYDDPARYLNDKLTALRPKTREFVSLALIRLALQDPQQAAEEMNKLRWRAQLNEEERSWVWGVIGKRAAQRMLPEAAAYFGNGQLSQMHEDHLAWAARAGLRAGNWKLVQAAIGAMPAAMRAEPVWTYWQARALLNLEPTEGARAMAQHLLETIASVRGFYEQLALEDLGQRVTVPDRPPAPDADEKDAARNNPGLNRALYAIQIGLRSEGVREWNYTTNLHQRGGMDDRSLLAAADLACSREIWDRCINSSEHTRSFIDVQQRYPTPYRNQVLARTRLIGLDPAYVYGLIRQESRFIVDARSGVGASGLMQIMPATARWTAKKIGLSDFQSRQIGDRDVNLSLGTSYLKLLLDNFGGSMPLATAAYNAGPGRPRVWRGSAGAPVLEGAIWAETLPFSETRDYVKKVLANTTLYAALLSGEPQSLRARLGTVGPLESDIQDPSAELP